jgi:hypothetical protein
VRASAHAGQGNARCRGFPTRCGPPSPLIRDGPSRFTAGRAQLLGVFTEIGQVVEHVRDSDAHGTIVDIHDPRGDRIEVSVE